MAIRLINDKRQQKQQGKGAADLRKVLLVVAILTTLVWIQMLIFRHARIHHLLSSLGKEENRTARSGSHDGGSSVNDRLTLHRPGVDSPVLQYCNSSAMDENDDCWEPSDVEGSWVLRNNATTASNSRNMCPGWNFGQTCDNGYARNTECRGFVDEYRWDRTATSKDRSSPRHSFDNNSFDPEDACRLLGPNRAVLMIGDSTMGQAASEMMNELFPGGCQQQVKNVLSDSLVNKYLGMPGVGGMNRGPHWSKPIMKLAGTKNQQTIVIYSIGPHIYGEDNFRDVFEETLHFAMEMEKNHPNLQFVYKTHNTAGCSHSISAKPPDQTARKWSPEGGYTNQHDKFYARDLYTIGRLHSLSRPFLDLRMLYGRSDAHPGSATYIFGKKKQDCLHHCSPGPLRVVAHLFYDLLRNGL